MPAHRARRSPPVRRDPRQRGSSPGMRRVVVTGMGLVTPLGIGLEQVWRRLLAGESGIRAIQSFDVSDLPSRIGGAGAARRPRIRAVQRRRLGAAEGPAAHGRVHRLCAWPRPHRRSRMPAGSPTDEEERERTGVMIGSGIGGLPGITDGAITLAGARPAPGDAVLHSRQPDQPRLRPRLDPLRLQGARTTPWSPPARPARTRSATRRG